MNIKIKSKHSEIVALSDSLITLSEYIKSNSIKPKSISLSEDSITVEISLDDFISVFQNCKIDVFSGREQDLLVRIEAGIKCTSLKDKTPKQEIISSLQLVRN